MSSFLTSIKVPDLTESCGEGRGTSMLCPGRVVRLISQLLNLLNEAVEASTNLGVCQDRQQLV